MRIRQLKENPQTIFFGENIMKYPVSSPVAIVPQSFVNVVIALWYLSRFLLLPVIFVSCFIPRVTQASSVCAHESRGIISSKDKVHGFSILSCALERYIGYYFVATNCATVIKNLVTEYIIN